MNRREIIKQGSILGFLGGLIGINVIPAKEEINKDKLLELFANFIDERAVIEDIEQELITEDDAKLIIEIVKIPQAACSLVEFNKNNKEWAEKIIEKATTNNPAYAAYLMVRDHGSSHKWAESVIERATIGNPAWAAYLMVRHCGSSREWAESVFEKGSSERSIAGAYSMVLGCGSSKEWADKIKAKHGVA